MRSTPDLCVSIATLCQLLAGNLQERRETQLDMLQEVHAISCSIFLLFILEFAESIEMASCWVKLGRAAAACRRALLSRLRCCSRLRSRLPDPWVSRRLKWSDGCCPADGRGKKQQQQQQQSW
jgi:hypothetical protein